MAQNRTTGSLSGKDVFMKAWGNVNGLNTDYIFKGNEPRPRPLLFLICRTIHLLKA